MGEHSKIAWCDHTWNPWVGCTKVSPGCDHCYAERDFDTRRGYAQWGHGEVRRRTSPSTWAKPRSWNRKAAATRTRPRVFCASLCDIFDPAVDPHWLQEAAKVWHLCDALRWLLLTKRAAEARDWFGRYGAFARSDNRWLGVSAENQECFDLRVRDLVATPHVAGRFLSLEPLLGPIDLRLGSLPHSAIDWVIVGGESGPQARPLRPEWARSIRDQCAQFGVPFFFKQWGEWAPYPGNVGIPDRSVVVWRVGRAAAGDLIDGVQHRAFPQALKGAP